MGSSDSDTESECFESAEEDFDEEEEGKKYEKTILKKNLQKSENEKSKLVISDCNAVESVSAVEGDTSSSTLSYRKRPERVKSQLSRTQTKRVSKSPTNELIFKADKIVPDVSLQDITSNLSKNINKSLSTLQQTSSNVKDMILNSLPVSSINDNKGFSYDDKSILCVDENNALGPEANQQNNIQTVELQGNITCENDKESIKDETSNAESELPIGRESDNNERELEDNGSLKNITTEDNFKHETLNIDKENFEKDSNVCLDSDSLKIQAENICKKAINIVPSENEEITQDVNDIFLNNEILAQEEETNENNNPTESVNFIKETDQKTEIFEENKDICLEPEINVKLKEEKETLESNKFFKPVDIDNSEDNANLVNSDEDNINHVMEDKNKIDAKCNFEELKTALKNIVNNDENTSAKVNDDFEDKNKINEGSGDGWDDFDFSDDDIENSNANNSYKDKDSEDIKTKNEPTKSKSPVLDLKSSKTKVETEKSKNLVESEKNLEETSIPRKSLAEKENLNITNRKKNKEESFKEVEKPKKHSETSVVENDSWDWDNWDEITESKSVEPTSSEKSEMKKDKGNSFDVSNWSGWDTFGQKPQEKQDNNWSLGSWGVDALLNKATAVTQGISSVLEAGLGAPDPETLARMEKIERENSSESVKQVVCGENENPGEISKKNSLTNVNIFPVSGITSLVAGVTSKIVEHSKIQEIGSKVITGGLETLETFGKKTMEVLQEGDPGLKNKRALLLGNNKPVLSQVLKEAREKADRESKKAEEKELAKKCHFETLFDDFQGMVHLEALEMLSTQCELKLDQIRSGMNSEEQEDLDGILEEVEQLCSLDEYDIDMKSSVLDFKTLLQMAVEPLKNEISIQNIIQIHEDVSKWLQKSSETELSFTVINQKLVSTLAELTAATVHQFHKSGELLSIKECRKTVEEVDALLRLTNALCTEINKLGDKFIKLSSNRISTDSIGDNANSISEKVNNPMKNSVLYIRQAFNLLIPVMQLGAAV